MSNLSKLRPEAQGLYDPSNEHDACGVGFVAHIKGQRAHEIVSQGLKILENLDHRGAVGADELMGDGAGILIQIPDQFYREEMAKQSIKLPPDGEYGVGREPSEAKVKSSWVGETYRLIPTWQCRQMSDNPSP